MRTQQACAVHQPLEGNDHRQHAIHCQPAIGVIEKQPLHAVVRHLANLGVVGRIQIEQRKGLRLGDGVEGVALNGLDALRLSNQRALGIEFDAVAAHIRALRDDFERRSLPNAGIDDRRRAGKAEQCAKPHGLAFRKRVIAHLQPRRVARHGSSLDDELWVLNRVVYFSMGGALRTMVKDILSAIDAEIACLEQAKALLSASGAVVAKRKPGRPPRLLLLWLRRFRRPGSAAR